MIFSGNEILMLIKGHNSLTNLIIKTGNHPNLDFVGQIMSICSRDIERKQNSERNSDINQGP